VNPGSRMSPLNKGLHPGGIRKEKKRKENKKKVKIFAK
jgi:hypothetical protein